MATRTLSLLPISLPFSSSDSIKTGRSPLTPLWNSKSDGLVNPLFRNLVIPSTKSSPFFGRRGSSVTKVFSMLPTAEPERASTIKIPLWSERAIKSFGMAELEARKLKYPKTGTEALLMGILIEGTSHASKYLREHGITLFKVREETIKNLGKSDLYFFSPEHPPLTEPAQRALDWAVNEKLKSGESGEITTTHLLLGIWSEEDSGGHKIMAALGFDDKKAKEMIKSSKLECL